VEQIIVDIVWLLAGICKLNPNWMTGAEQLGIHLYRVGLTILVYYYFTRFGYSITTYNCPARYAGGLAGELQQLVPPTPPL